MLVFFKNVFFFSFIVPVIVFAILIFDTILLMIRKKIKKQGIATADHEHIHYQLMNMGYSHRTSVLIIYAFSIFFGCMAIIFNSATLLTSLIILGIIFIVIQLISEIAVITFFRYQPMLNRLNRVSVRENK